MNYEVRRHGENYKIYEIPTQQYIYKDSQRITAESLCDSLNKGSGFDGETPRFFNNLASGVDISEFT
jgi:pantothenate kinase